MTTAMRVSFGSICDQYAHAMDLGSGIAVLPKFSGSIVTNDG